jgi:hypothetical protein
VSAVDDAVATAPTVEEVAAALGADATELRLYVERRDPSAVGVLGRFLGDPTHRDLVERWLAARGAAGGGRR